MAEELNSFFGPVRHRTRTNLQYSVPSPLLQCFALYFQEQKDTSAALPYAYLSRFAIITHNMHSHKVWGPCSLCFF